MTVREVLVERLHALPGVTQGRSRNGHGSSFFTGGREIAHFHGERRMDVRLTKSEIQRRKDEGTLDPRMTARGPSAEWVEVRLGNAGDVPFAVELVEDAVRANS